MIGLSLEEIASLIHEYRNFLKRGDLTVEETTRFNRVSDILSKITLSGDQIMDMSSFDPAGIISEKEIKETATYQELKRSYDSTEEAYIEVVEKYQNLKSQLERALEPFSKLLDLAKRE